MKEKLPPPKTGLDFGAMMDEIDKEEEAHRCGSTEDGDDAVSASGETEEDKGRGERLPLLQCLGLGDYIIRDPRAAGRRRRIFLREGEIHLAINTESRKAREESCYRDRTRHHQ